MFGGFFANIQSSVGFSPLDLNPFIWLDAANGIIESGGVISQWSDQSGNSNNFIQVAGTRQPILNISDANFNGFPSITFDGNNDVLGNAGLLLDNNFSEGVLIVVMKTNDNSTQVLFSFNGSAKRKFTTQIGVAGAVDSFISWNHVSGGGFGTYNSINLDLNPLIFTQKYDGAEDSPVNRISQFINGVEITPNEVSGSTPSIITDSDTGVYIGNRDNASSLSFNGEIAELFYFKSLTPSNQLKIETYLIDKYGF